MSRETSRGRATVRQLCQAFAVSRQAYDRAHNAPQAPDGPERPRRRRAGPWASDGELEAAIRQVVADHPAWGVRKVCAWLRRQGVIASRNRVWARMGRMGLVLPPANEREPRVRRGQVVAAEPNRRWASDMTPAWTARDGGPRSRRGSTAGIATLWPVRSPRADKRQWCSLRRPARRPGLRFPCGRAPRPCVAHGPRQPIHRQGL